MRRTTDFRHSVVFRMSAGYGVLLLVSAALISSVFYVGTAGLINRNIDTQLGTIARHLADVHRQRGIGALAYEINSLLTDDKESDTEIYLLLDGSGGKLVGNLTAWPPPASIEEGLQPIEVQRLGKRSRSRLLATRLAGGGLLLVGRDMDDVRKLEHMILTALMLSGALTLLLIGLGAVLFRRQLQRPLRAIHRATVEVAGGRLDRRIAIGGSRDEFATVARDINGMLEQIERLMNAAHNVSNAIAHNLRTPLGRIRAALEQALRSSDGGQRLPQGARYAIGEIDDLIVVLDKLLQIAEAESGVRRQSFEPLQVRELLGDLAELYQPAAEAGGIVLTCGVEGDPRILADRHLLAGTLANLLDNAFKYAGAGAHVELRAAEQGGQVVITVQDDGPGVAPAALPRITERFFRASAGDAHPRGNGLGLSIAEAVVSLHRGQLTLENTAPGLKVSLLLPAANLSKL